MITYFYPLLSLLILYGCIMHRPANRATALKTETNDQVQRGSYAMNLVNVLIVTGMDHPAHDWPITTKALKKELSKDNRITLDILEDPYALDSMLLSQYDVVFLHFNNWEKPDPVDSVQKSLKNFTSRGGGLVLLHFACGAFREWKEFPDLAGKVWDGVHTHDPFGRFKVEITNTAHPITHDIKSFYTNDELYIGIYGEKTVEVLARARSKVTGKYHPMAFVHDYDKGHVFNIVLGHNAAAIHNKNTAELIRKGVLWVGGVI